MTDGELEQEARIALDISATQVGFGFGFRDVLSDVGEWSPQLKQMFGLAPDAPLPTREGLLALVDPRERERVRAEIMQMPEVGSVRIFEYPVCLPDGTRRVLMTRAVVRGDAAGRPWRYYFVVVDLTESRARDRRVAELLERLQIATESSGIGTWDRDPREPRARWDDTTLALFGLPPGALPPDRAEYLRIVHPEDRSHVTAQIESDLPTMEFEFRVLLPDGGTRWLVTRGRSILDDSGTVVRRTGICMDITARKHAEAALQAKEVAERANAAKTEFLSRMSHELRTQLNAVLGFAQVMAMDPAEPLTETQRQRVGHIQTAGWHLLALINDVLDLARIEAREAMLVPATVHLAEVIDECMAMNATAAAERSVVQVPLAREALPATVWVDRTRLKQVLLNLLSNAVKYNRPGGQVRVTARALGERQAEIEVRDTGVGLDAQQLSRLFEPFNRLGREHGAIEGTGIGLALSRLIAQQMGGSLDARSVVGEGSTFRLVVPTRP